MNMLNFPVSFSITEEHSLEINFKKTRLSWEIELGGWPRTEADALKLQVRPPVDSNVIFPMHQQTHD